MRFITVAGSEPSRNPVIAVMMSPALRPYSRETGEAGTAPVAWQPEQDAAPGGGSDAASSGEPDAMTVAIAMATQNVFISEYPEGWAGGGP